jgi:hypothetical protein
MTKDAALLLTSANIYIYIFFLQWLDILGNKWGQMNWQPVLDSRIVYMSLARPIDKLAFVPSPRYASPTGY